MRSLKEWVMKDMDGIVRVACRDTGKTRKFSLTRRSSLRKQENVIVEG